MHRIYDPNTGFRGSIANWTKQYGKIFGILFFRHPMLVVTDIEAVKDILVKDFNNYSDRFGGEDGLYQPIITKSILLNGGEDWKRVRRVMSPSFSFGKLKLLSGHINTTAYKLVESLHKYVEKGARPEAKVVFSAFSLDVLSAAAFGLEMDSQNDLEGSFYKHAKGLVTFSKSTQLVIGALGAFPFLGRIFKKLNIGFFNSSDIQYFTELFTKLISQRRDDLVNNNHIDKDTSFLYFLINGEHDSTDDKMGNKGLTTEEIVAQCIIFVIAGYETTSATLQWLAFELSKNKHIQQHLRQEISDVIGDTSKQVSYEHCQKLKYMDAVIQETLRMYPPVVTLSRKSKNATRLNGMCVPAGSAVVIPVYNVCRDQDVFQNPDTFNPHRFLDDSNTLSSLLTSLPFGFGPRQCLGYSLAMLQVKIALVHVLRDFIIEDATPRQVEMDDFTALLIPKTPIQLTLTKHEM